jgi:hypothetical protein
VGGDKIALGTKRGRDCEEKFQKDLGMIISVTRAKSETRNSLLGLPAKLRPPPVPPLGVVPI